MLKLPQPERAGDKRRRGRSLTAPRHLPVCAAAVVVLLLGTGLAVQATPLPIGKVESGLTTSEKPAVFEFNAASAGLLSVAVQGDGDIALMVVDEDGQAVPDGSSDRDLNGSSGAEQVLVTITEAGTYRVQVKLLDGQGKFQIGAAWIPFPARARPSDPDKRPATARAPGPAAARSGSSPSSPP